MSREERILDDGRKIRYEIYEWTNRQTDQPYYSVGVLLYKRKRRWLTLGLTKKWSRVEHARNRRVDRPADEGKLREEVEKLRKEVFGGSPLDRMLSNIVEDIEGESEELSE